MALCAINIQVLHRNLLRFHTGPELLIKEPLINGSETARPDEITTGEVAGGGLELGHGEHIKVRSSKSKREVFRRQQLHGVNAGERFA